MSLRRVVRAPSWDDDDCDIKIFEIFGLSFNTDIRPVECWALSPQPPVPPSLICAILRGNWATPRCYWSEFPHPAHPSEDASWLCSHLHNGPASDWMILVHTELQQLGLAQDSGEGICRRLHKPPCGQGSLRASTNGSKRVWYSAVCSIPGQGEAEKKLIKTLFLDKNLSRIKHCLHFR